MVAKDMIKLFGYSSDEEQVPLYLIRSDRQRAKERKRRANNIELKTDEWFVYNVNGEKRYYKTYQNLSNFLGIGQPTKEEQPKDKCCYCEIALTKKNYTREHVIPNRVGGKIIKPCCRECNEEKGGQMLHSYIQWLKGLPKCEKNFTKLKNAIRIWGELQ